MLFSRVPWTVRLLGLLLCPIAGGAMAVLHHVAPGSRLFEFACGYAFGMLACLLLGAWLHFSAGHDLTGRRTDTGT